jgi:hypothetical protein
MSTLLKTFLFVTTFVATGFAQTPATQPATAPAAASSSFDAELASIDALALAHRDLSASFVQEKHSALLRKPLVSKGRVFAKGPLTLWVTESPEVSRMLIDPQWLRLYYPKQKVVEEYPVRGQMSAMASSPLPALGAIRGNFTIMPDAGDGLDPIEPAGRTKAIRLDPIGDLKPFVGFVRVLLEADRGLVLTFEVTDPDGERTTVRFTDLQPDRGLTDRDLQLDVPAGTKVVRPVGDQMPDRP